MAKLKVGDAMWWRGMRAKVTEIFDGKFRYETVTARVEQPEWVSRDGETVGRSLPAYVCISSLAEAKWDSELGFWFLPGVQGEIPTVHIAEDGTAEVLDPEPPRCTCTNEAHGHDAPHGLITHRVGPICAPCRQAEAEALEPIRGESEET